MIHCCWESDNLSSTRDVVCSTLGRTDSVRRKATVRNTPSLYGHGLVFKLCQRGNDRTIQPLKFVRSRHFLVTVLARVTT